MSSAKILVVGGGPAGASAGYWLARRGFDVTIVEKKAYPRDKTCGDGLTPRAVRQLTDMGFDFAVPELHKIIGLRAYAGDLMIEMLWPDHSVYPSWGATLRRADLDMQVAMLAEKQGAVVRQRTEAKAIMEDGALIGVELAENGDDVEVVDPDFVVIADGSLSRFGRALGTGRRKDYPYALAVRGYYESPNSSDGFIESQLNMRDRDGRIMPAYGWVFPLGDGTVNIGAGVMSTFAGWKDVNTSEILDSYVAALPEHWEVTEDSQLTKPVGGKLPMALSVGPKVGRNWLVVGDASGAVNPFNGEGIDYAYETSRLAAEYIEMAVGSGDPGVLHRYPQALDDEYSAYHKVARTFAIAVGNPAVMRVLTRVGFRSRPLMDWTLKVMANLLEPEDRGMTEHIYQAIERVVSAAPDPGRSNARV